MRKRYPSLTWASRYLETCEPHAYMLKIGVNSPGYALVEYLCAPGEYRGDDAGVQIRADARLYGEWSGQKDVSTCTDAHLIVA